MKNKNFLLESKIKKRKHKRNRTTSVMHQGNHHKVPKYTKPRLLKSSTFLILVLRHWWLGFVDSDPI